MALPPFSIKAALDKYIDSVTDEREPDGRWHPSSMFLCNRQAIYQVRGTERSEELDDASKRRFYIGHRLHEAVQRAVEWSPAIKHFYPEFIIDIPELNIKGAGDGLIEFWDGTFVVLEVKSIKKMGVRFGLPKDQHKKQAKVYAWGAKYYGSSVIDEEGNAIQIEPLGDKLTGIIMVYLEKEELDIWDYFLEYTNQWDIDIENQLNELDVYREDPDSLPPRLPLKKDGKKQWPCNYCPWKTKCWKVDPSKIPVKEIF